MKMISFAYTSPALVAGVKKVTRREWKNSHARRFHAEELVAAYDRQPLYGGKKLGVIELTEHPLFTAELPDEDWELEGFEFLVQRGLMVGRQEPRVTWDEWKQNSSPLWVVRFMLVDLTFEGEQLKQRVLAGCQTGEPWITP